MLSNDLMRRKLILKDHQFCQSVLHTIRTGGEVSLTGNLMLCLFNHPLYQLLAHERILYPVLFSLVTGGKHKGSHLAHEDRKSGEGTVIPPGGWQWPVYAALGL